MSEQPLVLGIETSCDETGVALVRGCTLLGEDVASSVEQHARFGGVVPEVASRAHLEALPHAARRAVEQAGVGLGDIDAVAVTAGPGLAGALLVGVSAAKAYALALDVPLYGVNHLVGHVAVDQLEHGPLPRPAVALLVSGGHTSLLLVNSLATDVRLLGETVDDAAGEAYDKVARLLGLAYPGGPEIDRVAREVADSDGLRFPRGKWGDGTFDFSFSGLKTAVARWVEDAEREGSSLDVPRVAHAFQEAVTDVLTRKAVEACQAHGVQHLVISGGVAANSRLRAQAEQRAAQAGIQVRVPRPKLCTDNGAMIAALGAEVVAAGLPPSQLDLATDTSLPVQQVLAA